MVDLPSRRIHDGISRRVRGKRRRDELERVSQSMEFREFLSAKMANPSGWRVLKRKRRGEGYRVWDSDLGRDFGTSPRCVSFRLRGG